MNKSILLQGGTVLTHSSDEHVVPLYNADVLVTGNLIAEVGKSIHVSSADTEVIDCHGKIISPGFVDTHHHLWQTQLKGRHADEGLAAYMVSGNLMSYVYEARDAYWGQLSGCLEAINCGTTLVLDHAHIVYTPEHANSALSATIDSGIRAIFAYTVPIRMTQWDKTSCVPNQELLPDWALSQIGNWTQQYNHKSAMVEVGMGFDLWFLPRDMVLGMLERLRAKALRVLTTHVGRNAFQGLDSVVELFSSYDLLQHPYEPSDTTAKLPFLLLSHCTGLQDKDLSILASTGTPISSTPDTEAHMGMGWSVSLHPAMRRHKSANISLGVDCHSSNPSSIALQARALLQLARLEHNNRLLANDQFPAANVKSSSEEAFNLMTIRGARCLGLDGEVGSIAKGKNADLVIFDAKNSVGMLSAVEYDPVTAIVRFSEAADIDTVIINGEIRKRNGRLVDLAVSGDGVEGKAVNGNKTPMPWSQIAEEVRKSQKDIQARVDGLSIEQGRNTLLGMFHVDQSKLVDAS